MSPGEGVDDEPNEKERNGEEIRSENDIPGPMFALELSIHLSTDITSDSRSESVENDRRGDQRAVPMDSEHPTDGEEKNAGEDREELRTNAENRTEQFAITRKTKDIGVNDLPAVLFFVAFLFIVFASIAIQIVFQDTRLNDNRTSLATPD